MAQADAKGYDNFWGEHGADEWSDAIVGAMKQGGVDHLFFVSGTEMNFFQEACAKAAARGWPAPKLITMVHESVTLHAAIGSSMVSGKPTATTVHVDVGTLHYGAAIHSAWRGGMPILITAGTGPRAFPGTMRGSRNSPIQWVQEPRDQGEIVRQYTKIDHRLEHQDNPGLIVSRLLQVAMSGPQGPVYLALPRETAMLPLPGRTRYPTRDQLGLARPVWPDPDDARSIAKWLIKAENPCIFADRLGQDPGAVADLVRLAELLAVPVTEGQNANRLNFPATHALNGTGPSPKDADVALVFECIPPWQPGVNSPAADAKIAWVTLDPVLSRFKTVEFRADLWISASPGMVARAIHDAATSMLDKSDLSRIEARRKRLDARKKEIMVKEESLALEAGKLAKPSGRWVGYQLGQVLDPDAIVLNDGLSNGGFVQTWARRTKPGTYFRSGGSTGGWGSGAAFGAKMAAPDRDVVLASGDGYYMFGQPMAALWAASHHEAPYLSVVFVNGTYSTGTTGLRDSYPDGYAVRSNNYAGGSFDPPPDFSKLAQTVGGHGEFVTEAAEVGPALKRALQHVREGQPSVVAVRVPGPLQQGEAARATAAAPARAKQED